MLELMGNEKYPVENSLDDFLEKGKHPPNERLFTMHIQSVNRHFNMSVLPDHIDQALDRFANVFVKPLLRADSFCYILEMKSKSCGQRCY